MSTLALTGKKAVRTAQIMQCKKEYAERKMTVKQWCEENGISESSYWYYHKRISDTLVETALNTEAADSSVSHRSLSIPQFVQIPESTVAATDGKAAIRIGPMMIELDESISDSFLQRIMKAAANV